jgi:hypothetical protein
VTFSGRLGSGAITNNGTLYLDHAGSFSMAHGLNGGGSTYVRYGADVVADGGVSSNSVFRIGQGSLTLTNGAVFCAYGELNVADRQNVYYATAPTNIVAAVNIYDGCTLTAKAMTFGMAWISRAVP